jgi:hypothetical protein
MTLALVILVTRLALMVLLVVVVQIPTTAGARDVAITSCIASPRNVTMVRTIFEDPQHKFGYRDPTAPVYDGQYWHVWATKIRGTGGGYPGVIWHLYSKELDAVWLDGGLALNRSYHDTYSTTAPDAGPPVFWDSYGVFTPSIAWEGVGGKLVSAQQASRWFLFFGGVSHPQPIYDEAIGIASAPSPFGPWEKFVGNPIITGVCAKS